MAVLEDFLGANTKPTLMGNYNLDMTKVDTLTYTVVEVLSVS